MTLLWDSRFLDLARHIAQWSKDPSTKTGAVIVQGKEIIGLGYNGFAKGILDGPEDLNNRAFKISHIIHADLNAILMAGRERIKASPATIYTWPFMPCSACAGVIIQSEIKRVVAPFISTDDSLYQRWRCDITVHLFHTVGVTLDLIK